MSPPERGISVIMAAYNAESTIARALDSIRAQTESAWEVVVVDDGSTDGTAAVVERYAAQDGRIRLLRQPNAGPSAARNRGIAAAGTDWLLFLDADDWVMSDLFARVRGRLADDPALDVVHYGWRRVWPDGTLIDERIGPSATNPFPQLAHHCAFMIHAAVVRKGAVMKAGGFDETLRAAEDWLLWQRIARLGSRFARIDATLAVYRCSPGSLSKNLDAMARACLRVFELGHSYDPTLPLLPPCPNADESRRTGILRLVAWLAGALAGSDRDPAELIEAIPTDALVSDPAGVARAMIDGLVVAAGREPNWPELWDAIRTRLAAFLSGVERKVASPRLTERVLRRAEEGIALLASRRSPLVVGETLGAAVEVTGPITDLAAAGASRLALSVLLGGSPIAEIELPVFDGEVKRGVLVDAIADRCAWTIFGAYLRRIRYADVTFRTEGTAGSAWRGDELLWRGELAHQTDPFSAFHDQTSWDELLRQVWRGAAPGEPVTMDPGRVMPVEITDPVPSIRVAGSVILIEARLAGCAIAQVPIAVPEDGLLTAEAIRLAIGHDAGYELCRVAVREGLIGRPFDDGSTLAARLSEQARNAEVAGPFLETWSEPLETGWRRSAAWALSGEPGLVVGRRLPPNLGSGADRRASLPSGAADRLLAAESRWGTPLIRSVNPTPNRVYYAPELFPRDRCPELPDREPARPPVQSRLPILMYHRVSPVRSALRERWRVAPERFEMQLAALKSAGVRTATFDQWRRAKHGRRPISGPAVILTFDDGFLDFEMYALPLLERYGFSATVFLVTGSVGRFNTWDPEGHWEPLLDWDQVGRLRAKGIEFGSHTVTHPELSLCPAERAFDELLDSRVALEDRLGEPIRAIAYPYGDVDPITRHLAGAAGYGYGVTCRFGPATLADGLLDLPRIEVARDLSGPALLRLLEPDLATAA